MLHSHAYVSRALIPAHSVDILDIARASMRNNRAMDVTGALYFDDDQFFQVLEGPRDAVAALFARIANDHRHTDVATLFEGPIAERRFPQWSMKFVDGAWVPGGRLRFSYDTLTTAPPWAVRETLSGLDAL